MLSLKEGLRLGLDPGSEYICKKYQDLSYANAFLLYQTTDKLNSIFLKNKSTDKLLRSFGFSIINQSDMLKKRITNIAMGI